jgi:predicted RNA binding protein YcfA (HicA-like mRNA interferase family)
MTTNMIYTVDYARQLIADGWFLSRRKGGIYWMVRGDKQEELRVYRNVALKLLESTS